MNKETVEIREKSEDEGFNFETRAGVATIYRLDCPKLAEQVKIFAQWHLLDWKHKRLHEELKKYYAVKFTIDNCVAYVICLEGRMPENIVRLYKLKLLDGLYESVFSIVCNGYVHEWAGRTGGIILHAIAANKNPNVEILLTER